jgi:hypothetical protein
MIRHPCHLFLLLLSLATAVSAAPALSGRWTVDPEHSDDVAERLRGLSVIRVQPKSVVEAERDRDRAGMSRQARVYDELQLSKERKRIRAVADVGHLTRVLHAASIEIEEAAGAIEVTYDGGFTRHLAPRAGGPRYSAKGDEFVPDELGRSMVYWRGDTLVVETMLAPRGRMTEEFSLQSGAPPLRVHTKISNPDWVLDADIVRVFKPAL